MDDQLELGLHMNKLTIALIASAFAATAAAQTGIVATATVGDHGSPAMHAAETARNVQASKAVIGLSDTASRQQAVKEATRVADHGTPVIDAEDARKNVAASSGQPGRLANDATSQEAARQAVEGQKK
jgi:hypothetical protein